MAEDELDPRGRSDPHRLATLSGTVLLILALVFSAATAGALVLVAVDLSIGRPAAGDLFIAFLNGATAVVLWARRSRS